VVENAGWRFEDGTSGGALAPSFRD